MHHEFIKLFELVVSASIVNNFVFTRFLGLCIFFGVSKRMETAAGMSITFTLVMIFSAVVNWVLYTFLLMPFGLSFLKILMFIGIIAALVQAADTIIRKVSPTLYKKLGIYLALISTNCIILAVPLINADKHYSLLESVTFGLGSGIGFAIALVIMASIREKLERARVPKAFQGHPIAFIVAGMIAMAFSGLAGLIQ